MDKTKKKTDKKDKDAAASKTNTEENQKTETSKSPEQTSRVTNIKPIKINFSVPSNIIERIDFVNKVFNNEELIYKNSNAPERDGVPLEEIGKYFTLEYNTYPMALGGILYYLSQNFTIDREAFEQSKPAKQDVTTVIKTGKAASEGIAKLFIEICKSIHINCQLVTGLVKRKGYKQGDSLRRHNWVMIKVSGKSYLIDPCLFMGEQAPENEDSQPEKQFHPYYFLTPPELLIDSHRPDEDEFQLLSKPVPVKSFILKPLADVESFYYEAFKNKIELISHPFQEFECKDSEVNIKFNLENLIPSADVEFKGKPYVVKEDDKDNKDKDNKENKDKKSKTETKMYDVKFNEAEKHYVLHLKFKEDGPYTVILKGRKNTQNEEKPHPILRYKIKVTIINIIKPPLKKVLDNFKYRQTSVGNRDLSQKKPVVEKRKLTKSASDFEKKKKMKCYDNKNAHLYEPKSDFLKVGQSLNFKVKIRGAKSVVVLDGKHWNYLKRREDDIYEGNVTIKTSNVAICMLKPGGVYTEVFEFFAIKRETNLPK